MRVMMFVIRGCGGGRGRGEVIIDLWDWRFGRSGMCVVVAEKGVVFVFPSSLAFFVYDAVNIFVVFFFRRQIWIVGEGGGGGGGGDRKGVYYGYISTTLCCFGCLVNLGDIDGVWR